MKLMALVCLMLTGCYALTGNGKMGACEMPPLNQEGYTLVACSVEADAWDKLTCWYAKETAANVQIRTVISRGCTGFELLDQNVVPKG